MNSKNIKSYILRQAKITVGQKNALQRLNPNYTIDYVDQVLNLEQIYASSKPKIIEIGFGMGDSLINTAQNFPTNDYLGIEVHAPGVGALLIKLEQLKLNNLKLIHHDATTVMDNMIADDSITGIHIYFPDPWQKKRHHKRRIIQQKFLELLQQKLKFNGYIHLVTDWQNYADSMTELLNLTKGLVNQAQVGNYITRPNSRPITKFELRALSLGHKICDLLYFKTS